VLSEFIEHLPAATEFGVRIEPNTKAYFILIKNYNYFACNILILNVNLSHLYSYTKLVYTRRDSEDAVGKLKTFDASITKDKK
jgi:hypothetical protein